MSWTPFPWPACNTLGEAADQVLVDGCCSGQLISVACSSGVCITPHRPPELVLKAGCSIAL